MSMAKELNYIQFGELKRDPAAFIALLQEWGVIARSVRCNKCGHNKHLIPAPSAVDGFVWGCKNPEYKNNKRKKVGCYQKISIRTNTFFQKSHLTLCSILSFVRGWVTYSEIRSIMVEAEISQSTAADWNYFCREVVIHFCFTNSRPIGGPGEIVEIDILKFGRRKCNRGRSVKDQWVFGGIERGSGNFFLCTVEQRDVDTLVPLIQSQILPGSTVIYDCWRSDRGLQELLLHLTINHSATSVNPETGPHTNMVEGQWHHTKHRMQQLRRDKGFFPGYLAKFMFLNKMRRKNLDPTIEFMRAAGSLYNEKVPTSLAFSATPATDGSTDSE